MMMTGQPIVLVTGCSTGIGVHIAVGLAQAGHRVVATMRDLGKRHGLLVEAAKAGVELDIRALDVTDPAMIDTCVAELIADYGRIDVLVNNAGAGIIAPLEQTSDADLRWIMDVNFFGVWNLTKAVVPHMRKAAKGRIVSVTSVGGMVGQPLNDAYCAAKFAVEGMMESLAPIALAMGIRVSVVAPGPVNTEFMTSANAASKQATAAMAPPYDRIAENYHALSAKAFSTQGQSSADVAAIVVDVVLSEMPPFRTLTNEMVRAMVAAKAADETGNSVIENFARVVAAWE